MIKNILESFFYENLCVHNIQWNLSPSILYTYWLFMRTLIIWIILKLCIKRFAIIFAFFMLFFFLQIMEFLYKKKKISALFDNHPYPIRRSIPIASHTSIIRANYIEHAPLINDHNHCSLLAQAVAHPPTHNIIYIVYAIKHLMGGAPPPPRCSLVYLC